MKLDPECQELLIFFVDQDIFIAGDFLADPVCPGPGIWLYCINMMQLSGVRSGDTSALTEHQA